MRKGLLALVVLAAAAWLGRDWLLGLVSDSAPQVTGDRGGDGDRQPARPGGSAGDRLEPRPLGSLAGREVTVRLLTMSPADAYLAPIDGMGDAAAADEDRAAVRAADRRAIHDPHLSRAARELAAQAAALDAITPDGALTFVLHAAGAPEPTAFQFLSRTNAAGDGEIEQAVRAALGHWTGDPPRVGVGEASAEGRALDRFIVVLLSGRSYELDSLPRSAEPGASWPIRGRASGWRDLSASVLYPGGQVDTLDVDSRGGGRFAVDVPTGATPGTVAVSIDGRGPDGPGKLLQLTVEVGRPPPDEITVLVPPSEDALEDLPSAERFAFELLNLDRRRHGLEPLVYDPALAEIGRGHSEEMLASGFFAHRSPTTGLPLDRMRRAGYRASASGENIALNDSLAEAQASLMASVGHRKNVLEPRYTHAGVGLASRETDSDRTAWYLTQVFARKVDRVDPIEAREQILDWLNQERTAGGAGELRHDTALAAVAQRGADRAATGQSLARLPDEVGDEAQPVARGRALVSVQSFHHLSDFEVPEAATGRRFTAAGIGVSQAEGDGRIGVVVIVADGTEEAGG